MTRSRQLDKERCHGTKNGTLCGRRDAHDETDFEPVRDLRSFAPGTGLVTLRPFNPRKCSREWSPAGCGLVLPHPE